MLMTHQRYLWRRVNYKVIQVEEDRPGTDI